ncbi:FMN-binding glutamate synthase family protein [Thalassotalea ponticola]|uniref:FMN-binding glutamate synthase family protein n=1 Tax=Thalassotalea ponticola TaxID=1523392 RepID=UPI0025B5510A|nr:FMN-binding glutamate synthase family protein [Thalassotalea ponticola]MDN3651847.1 FMN-binding glutamate synthase family protein [Thalassotalea ponticola]
MKVRHVIFFTLIIANVVVLLTHWYGWLLLTIPLLVLAAYDVWQKRHTILQIYPVIGHLRYLFESIRPEIQQYFVESNINGRPFNREYRALVYQRAKGETDKRPFGTQFDVYRSGYEWIEHSLSPKAIITDNLTVRFGGDDCQQPYTASPFNISAMSYGALSKNAIMALNKGAKLGGFAHNTGEGGLSPHHLKYGGDLIWQIGTGYFGCRDEAGQFDAQLFAQKASLESVKMIELKLSQGAKPGHGGILPAQKLTEEIAAIRHVPMGQDVLSPMAHSAFSSPTGLLKFIRELRHLSAGKPVGFKFCLGNKCEFFAIAKAMLATNITPDFITVDGSEGGTGAAPIEFTNSVGTPLLDAIIFVDDVLVSLGLREHIKIIASGKIISAFHIAKIIAVGADAVNSARGMMFALGCIQSRSCNTDKCPTGIATQDPSRYRFLDIDEKSQRVCNYHNATMRHLTELLQACAITDLQQLTRQHIKRRINATSSTDYEALHPSQREGCLLKPDTVPVQWATDWHRASAEHW